METPDSQVTFTYSKSTIETLRKRYKMCSKLTRKTPEQPQSRGSSVYIFNFERISNLFLVSVLFVDIKQANVSRVNM